MDKIKTLIESYGKEIEVLSEYLDDLPRIDDFDAERSVCKARIDEKKMFIEVLKTF